MENDADDNDGAYTIITGDSYDVAILAGSEGLRSLDQTNDNVDVEVRFKDGRFYSATFFTIENLQSLFVGNKSTGEFASGLFFWCPDMIIVERLNARVIVDTVAELVMSDRLRDAFKVHIQDDA